MGLLLSPESDRLAHDTGHLLKQSEMPKINFYPRFIDQVRSGQLTQAIRFRRIQIGEMVELECWGAKLGRGRVVMVRDVLIDYRRYFPVIRVDGVSLSSKGMEEFARRCGFKELSDLIDFYAEFYCMPLRANLIHWENTSRKATNV